MAGVPGRATAGVQLSLTPPATFTAVTSVGPGGPDCSGPLGQPPMPGPPASPNSAMVRPCRLASASVSSQDSRRSPSPALAAILATAGSSKMYVAGNVSPLNVMPDRYPPRGAAVSGPGRARTSRRAPTGLGRAGPAVARLGVGGAPPG